jgi:hypothetical protein
MVTGTKMKDLESSMETPKAYLEMLDIFCISYTANANAIFEFFPYTPQL